AHVLENDPLIFDFLGRAYDNQAVYEEGHYGNNKALVSLFNESAAVNAKAASAMQHPKYQKALFRALESSKANDLKRSLDPETVPESMIKKESQLESALRRLEVAIGTTEGTDNEAYQNEYLTVANTYRGLWQQLQKDYGVELKAAFTDRNTTLSNLQESLADGVVFCHYLTPTELSEKQIIVQAITNKAVSSKVINLDFSLSEVIDEYRRLIRSPLQRQNKKRQRFIELSHQLYQVLIAPLGDQLKTATDLLICPDGDLYFVPFESLVASTEDLPYQELDYLVRNLTISYQYSGTVYLNTRQRQSAGEGVIAFAPVFSQGIDIAKETTSLRGIASGIKTSLQETGIEPLPATREEVAGVARAYGKESADVHQNQAATKARLQESLDAEKRIIHVATHGILNTENNDLSALACYGTSPQEADFLYANEIRNQAIKADLVVLSSCDSGLGRKVKGDGLI
ncbi:MAG: CHAT domain-containing protein, partial [Bacteroidota bacterium]